METEGLWTDNPMGAYGLAAQEVAVRGSTMFAGKYQARPPVSAFPGREERAHMANMAHVPLMFVAFGCLRQLHTSARVRLLWSGSRAPHRALRGAIDSYRMDRVRGCAGVNPAYCNRYLHPPFPSPNIWLDDRLRRKSGDVSTPTAPPRRRI